MTPELTMEESITRVERLLAMILLHDMHDAPQAERAMALSRAGFANKDIAELLGTKPAVVNQQLYELRKAGSRKSRKPTAKKRSRPASGRRG